MSYKCSVSGWGDKKPEKKKKTSFTINSHPPGRHRCVLQSNCSCRFKFVSCDQTHEAAFHFLPNPNPSRWSHPYIHTHPSSYSDHTVLSSSYDPSCHRMLMTSSLRQCLRSINQRSSHLIFWSHIDIIQFYMHVWANDIILLPFLANDITCIRLSHLLLSHPTKRTFSIPHLLYINILSSAKYFIPLIPFELKISGTRHSMTSGLQL